MNAKEAHALEMARRHDVEEIKQAALVESYLFVSVPGIKM